MKRVCNNVVLGFWPITVLVHSHHFLSAVFGSSRHLFSVRKLSQENKTSY